MLKQGGPLRYLCRRKQQCPSLPNDSIPIVSPVNPAFGRHHRAATALAPCVAPRSA